MLIKTFLNHFIKIRL